MGSTAAKTPRKAPEAGARARHRSVAAQPTSEGAQTVLMSFQRLRADRTGGQSRGNSTERLLDAFAGKPPGEPGRPLDEPTRLDMEARFGQDFTQVRVHSEGAAAMTACHAGAHAYTSGQHIAFAPGRYDPASTSGRSLLAHELAHVVQQQRGGAHPALGAGASHEHGADAAAAAYSAGSGPVSVAGATGVGMARSADEWLHGSVDLSGWRYSDLLAERSELQQWMDRQTAGDERTLQIEQAIATIDAKIRGLEQGVQGPKKPGKKGKNKKSQPAEASTPTTDAELEKEPPRCLVEQSTPVFTDQEDLRREFDHIVAWLQRKDVSPRDRQLLQQELQYLAPRLGQSLQQHADNKRRARIGVALTPSGGGSARAQILEAVRLVDSIKPVDGRDDQFYLMHGEEMLTMTKEEAMGIRARAMEAMSAAIKKVQDIDAGGYNKLQSQLSVDQDHPIAAAGVSLFTDMDTSEAVNRYLPISNATGAAISRFFAAKRSGNLAGMASALADAEEMAITGNNLINGHLDDIQTTGAKVITGLQITQAAAFTIVMVATAGAAAPAIGAGVTGAGITGVGGTLLTAGGTATVVGAEGFVLGGTGGTLGGLARGDSLSDSLSLGLGEGKKWGETGVKIGATAALAPAAAARFGASKEGIGLANQILRTGAATGTTNLAVDAGSRTLFHGESLSLGEARSSFTGGFLGGMGGPLINKIGSPSLRNAANVAWGGGTSGGLTYLETGDADKAWQSAGLGAASSLSLGDPHPSQKTLDAAYQGGQRLRSSVNSATRSAGNTLKSAMLGVKLSGAAPDISGGLNTGMWNRPIPGLVAPADPTSKAAISPKQDTVEASLPDAAETVTAKPTTQEHNTPPQSSEVGPSARAKVEPPASQQARTASQPAARQAHVPVRGRIAGEEVWAEISSEMGLGTAAQSTQSGIRGAVADAQSAGLIGVQGAPGTVDVAFQPHRNASDVRAEYGVTGAQEQSAHVNATSFLRDAPGYNREAAPTMLMSPATHRAFDNFWKSWARAQPKGRKTCTVAEMRGVMHAAINQIPNLTPRQRGTLAWQLELELQALGLQDTSSVRIPYSD